MPSLHHAQAFTHDQTEPYLGLHPAKSFQTALVTMMTFVSTSLRVIMHHDTAFFQHASDLVAALGPGWQFRSVNKKAQLLAFESRGPLRLRLASAGGTEAGIAVEIVDETNKPVQQPPDPVFWIVPNSVGPKQGAATLTKGLLDPFRDSMRLDRHEDDISGILERGFKKVFGHLPLHCRSNRTDSGA